jgi:glycosidase
MTWNPLRTLAWCLLIAAYGAAPARGDSPHVERISPPSWWPSPTSQRVLLLVEGRDVGAPLVEAVDRTDIGVGTSERRDVDFGAFFVQLELPANVRPGPVRLRFRGRDWVEDRDWSIVEPPTHRAGGFGPDDVLYLAMPDRFANGDPSNDRAAMEDAMLDRSDPHAYHGGDFAGLRQKLAYLADLGVTTLWLTPVYGQAPTWFYTKVNSEERRFADFHGYSPVEFYSTNPRFGTLEEYRDLVRAAHQHGLKIVQDQIVGYTGPQHRWVSRPPTFDWFHGSPESHLDCNFRFDAAANPHARLADRRGLTAGWFFGILPDLNTDFGLVWAYANQQSLWWAALFEADGIRLDTYPMVDRAFWRRWSEERRRLRPGLTAVGEAWVTDPAVLSFFVGGREGWDGIDPGVETVFDFPLSLALTDVVARHASVRKVGEVLAKDFVYPHPDQLVTFLDNHDTARLAGAPGVSPARYRLAAAFLLTIRGIPQLTWGDEIGLGGNSDDRRSIPGGWPGDSRDAFTAAGRTTEEQATFKVFRALISLRQRSVALRRGRTTELAASDTMYAFMRTHVDKNANATRVIVVLNMGSKAGQVALPGEELDREDTFERLYGEGTVGLEGKSIMAELPGEQALIVEVKR